MNIVFTKNNQSTHTITVLKDGQKFDEVTLDTKTYFLHDFTHYCVEMELKLKNGFWGMIHQGYKMEQLSGKTNELTEELRQIEHIVVATQSVFSKQITTDIFHTNIKLFNYSLHQGFLENTIESIRSVMNTWNYLSVGEALELEFNF